MMTEWPKVSGCKPADESLRRFESCSCYKKFYYKHLVLLYKKQISLKEIILETKQLWRNGKRATLRS